MSGASVAREPRASRHETPPTSPLQTQRCRQTAAFSVKGSAAEAGRDFYGGAGPPEPRFPAVAGSLQLRAEQIRAAGPRDAVGVCVHGAFDDELGGCRYAHAGGAGDEGAEAAAFGGREGVADVDRCAAVRRQCNFVVYRLAGLEHQPDARGSGKSRGVGDQDEGVEPARGVEFAAGDRPLEARLRRSRRVMGFDPA
jgi:hypothetical protein